VISSPIEHGPSHIRLFWGNNLHICVHIGIGCTAIGLAIVGGIVYFCIRKRNTPDTGKASDVPAMHEMGAQPTRQFEMEAQPTRQFEMEAGPATHKYPVELEG
jgi:hypothetical protein